MATLRGPGTLLLLPRTGFIGGDPSLVHTSQKEKGEEIPRAVSVKDKDGEPVSFFLCLRRGEVFVYYEMADV